MASSQRHEVLIVGGGSAGISVAARLRRAGLEDVGLVDPATTHYYQPLWTLVGGGCAPLAESARPQAKQVPRGVRWHRKAATAVDPGARTGTLSDGEQLEYRYLVMCPGIQLDWAKIPGLSDTLGRDGVSSNYTYETAPKTWEFIRALRSGTAIFGMPSGPIKCAGAPQKIAYLAADYWRQQGVLDDIRVVLVLPTPGMFGVAVFAKELEMVAKRYGIEVRFNSEVVAVDAPVHSAVIADKAAGTQETLRYDVMHLVPPQSAPDWVKASPLADTSTPNGYVEVDKHTLQHVRHPEVFALGDAGSSPNSKTGAAIRKQAPVVVQNLRDVRAGRTPTAHYDGYSSCPLTTARNKMLLAEFDYTMQPTPSIPFIDTTRERRDMWYLKRYGLPFLYWNLMLKGRA